MQPSEEESLAKNAVVFTGQFDRVRLGLQLLGEGRVERLFISGVNRGAGLHPEQFADQFGLSPRLRQAMTDSTLMLGTEANTTIENGIETACWYNQRKLEGKLLLITGRTHMPRASLVLESSLPGIKIERLPIDDADSAIPKLLKEFGKFLGTRGYLVLKQVSDGQKSSSNNLIPSCPGAEGQ